MRLQNSLLSNQQNKHAKIDNTEELSNIINQTDKTDSCRMYYPTAAEHTSSQMHTKKESPKLTTFWA